MSAAILTGLDLVIELYDRATAAAKYVKAAHAENRQLTSEELAAVKAPLDQHLSDLDAAIEKAKAEGR